MKNLKISVPVFICMLSFFSLRCASRTDNSGKQLSNYTLELDGIFRDGLLTYDPTLKAFVLPCQNNNTFRMYISDSLDRNTATAQPMNVVSYSNAGHLRKFDCYFEITTSATDTYLSFENLPNNFVLTAKPTNNLLPVANIAHIKLQHFTSSPQADITYLKYANLFVQ